MLAEADVPFGWQPTLIPPQSGAVNSSHKGAAGHHSPETETEAGAVSDDYGRPGFMKEIYLGEDAGRADGR